MKRLPLYLLMIIPAAGVLMGIIMLVIAFSQPSQEMRTNDVPMNKTSWKNPESEGVR